ncbi:hypothetical protein F5Y19DRAFT_477692 [Xylariaceae sp. FL1651]|nr:hypothetical protein F5Y19DRAFT_477692 [Xylariaceae sp. FL1651]
MVEPKSESPPNQGHALAIGFIESDLPRRHPYFENPPVRYDKQAARYVNVQTPEVSGTGRPGPAALPAPSPVHHVTDLALSVPSSKSSGNPEQNIHKAMTYWEMIFPSAMIEFQNLPGVEAPKHRKPAYDIRNDTTWSEVYGKLENARDYYTDQTGISGGIRRVWRWSAENATEPVRIAAKTIPQIDIISPVLAAVHIVLEAVKKGAEVRKETLNAFDELEDVFADVELFLGTFREEGLILTQAVSLVASVLLAMERGIGFFTRNGLFRGVKAIVRGKDYESPLLDSLTAITSQSKKLMTQVLKTHTLDFHKYSRASLRIFELIQKGQEETALNVIKFVSAAEAMNAKLDLLLGKHDEMKGELRRQNSKIRKQDQLLIAGAQEIGHLRNVVRSISPGRPNSMWAPPPHSSQLLPQLEAPYVDQRELWSLLDIYDIDTADMEGIEEKGKWLPSQDRARTEQIVHDQKFQEWIVSPESTKLMIYSNFSGLMMETSALSLFCTTLAKAFRARKRYLCLVWFCGRHLGYDDESDSGSSDSEDEFDEEFNLEHDEEDDYNPGTRQRVIKRMMRSLIAQLLCDYDFGPKHLLPPSVDPDVIEEGHSLSQLRRLFGWLVRQLPEEVTLFCLVDGIVFYEREDFEDPMLDVLGDLLELTASNDVLAAVKVLVTSPRPTSTVRAGFEDENINSDGAAEMKSSILCMDLLTPSHVDVSEERFNRNLGGIEKEKLRGGSEERDLT